MNKRLQAELWENQIWLMLILALLLDEAGHTRLFWVVIVWAFISFVGVIVKITRATIEEKAADKA